MGTGWVGERRGWLGRSWLGRSFAGPAGRIGGCGLLPRVLCVPGAEDGMWWDGSERCDGEVFGDSAWGGGADAPHGVVVVVVVVVPVSVVGEGGDILYLRYLYIHAYMPCHASDLVRTACL